MLVAHAHSFRQQARLAVTLAWVAGYTDILTLLSCGTFTSHVSGTTANMGRNVLGGVWQTAGFAGFLLLLFFLGAGLSGFCTELGKRRGWESIFVMPMVVEATLLAFFAFALMWTGAPDGHFVPMEFVMTGLASAAMGLQNATITQISRGHVRTTHVTGVLTDLGQEFFQYCWWRVDQRRESAPLPAANNHHEREHPTGQRLVLLAAIFTFFALGAGLATVVYAWRPPVAMFPPVLFLLWIIYQDVTTPIAEIEAVNIETYAAGLPSSLAVYRLHRESGGSGGVLRMPNLLAWSERLPEVSRVVVLDVVEIPELNTNAIMELKSLIERLGAEDRKLIIAGLSASNARRILGTTPDEGLVERICCDVDLAIARGLNWLNIGV